VRSVSSSLSGRLQVLCSVTDVQATLKELRRVVRPGGRVLFVEHVLSPQPGFLRTLQLLLNPLQQLLLDGCHTTRDTGAAGLHTLLPLWCTASLVSAALTWASLACGAPVSSYRCTLAHGSHVLCCAVLYCTACTVMLHRGSRCRWR
jgi:hypothetical protein